YAFTLPSASLLYFDALTSNFQLNWTLTGPAGNAVFLRSFNQSDATSTSANPVLNLVAGDYTLTIGAGGTTAPYSFRLFDLGQATPITPGTPVSGSLSPANETDLYRFDASAGDRFYFDVQARTGFSDADWRLIDPNGLVLFNTSFASATTSDV